MQQSTAVAIRIAVEALPDELHLLAIDFARITPRESAVAVRLYGCQQCWGDAYFLGRLRQVVAQASDIMQIHLQDGLVQRCQRLQGHVGSDVRIPVTVTADPRAVPQHCGDCGPIRFRIIGTQAGLKIFIHIKGDIHDHGREEVKTKVHLIGHGFMRGAGGGSARGPR